MSSSDPPSGAPAPSNMAAKPSSATDEMLEPIVEPIKIGLANIDKKIRNLEKKKSRLDALRDEVTKSGKPLNKDQSESLAKYEDNNQQLDTFRELQKQFLTCSEDIKKCYRKILKKEQKAEIDRLTDLLRYGAVVRALESEEVLMGLIEGTEVLPENTRENLKLLRQLLFPLRSDFVPSNTSDSFDDYCKSICEQQVNLLHGRPIQLGEAKLAEAKEFLDSIVGSPFFVQHPHMLFTASHSQPPSDGGMPKLTKNLPRDQDLCMSSSGINNSGLSIPAAHQIPSRHASFKSDISDSHSGGAFPSSSPIEYQHGSSLSFTNSKIGSSNMPPGFAGNSVGPSGGMVMGFGAGHGPSPSLISPPPPATVPYHPSVVTVNSAAHPHSNLPPSGAAGNSDGVIIPPPAVAADASRHTHRSVPSENGAVAQGQNAWQNHPIGTFDPQNPHGDDLNGGQSEVSPVDDQEKHGDQEDQSNKNRRGPGFMGDNADLPHSGAGFNNHRGGRGMMNRGRGYGRSFEEGRRDNYGDVDRRRDGGYMDRGGPLRGGHQGGGRYMAGDNRGFRGNRYEHNGSGDDGNPAVNMKVPGSVPNAGPGAGPGPGPGLNAVIGPGGAPNHTDFGVFHVDNPSYRGRTGLETRGGYMNRPQRGPSFRGNGYGGNGGNGRGHRDDYNS